LANSTNENKDNQAFGQINLSHNSFDIFELNLNNAIQYFSRIIIEKLYQVNLSFMYFNEILRKIYFILSFLSRKKQLLLNFSVRMMNYWAI
jgi:hypothetical protein